jgi:outer membrane biosynthesis protein TonB
VVGGHPVLVDAALQAAKGWKFEPSASETTEILEFRFEPQ